MTMKIPLGAGQPEFLCALTFLMAREGGYTVDQGGPTNYGVTQRVYDSFRRSQGLEPRTVLDIEMAEVINVVWGYWTSSGAAVCAQHSAAVGLLVLDFGYNAGPLQARRTLQRCLKVAADGKIGPLTLAALKASDPQAVAAEFQRQRAAFYVQLAQQPRHSSSLKGWLARVRWGSRAVGLPFDTSYA